MIICLYTDYCIFYGFGTLTRFPELSIASSTGPIRKLQCGRYQFPALNKKTVIKYEYMSVKELVSLGK